MPIGCFWLWYLWQICLEFNEISSRGFDLHKSRGLLNSINSSKSFHFVITQPIQSLEFFESGETNFSVRWKNLLSHSLTWEVGSLLLVKNLNFGIYGVGKLAQPFRKFGTPVVKSHSWRLIIEIWLGRISHTAYSTLRECVQSDEWLGMSHSSQCESHDICMILRNHVE